MKTHIFFIFLAVGLLGLSGCASPPNNTAVLPATSPPDSAALLPSPSPEVASTSDTCALSNISLDAWEQSLPFAELVLAAQFYQGQSTLTLWYADPNLSQSPLGEIDTWAAESAISTLKQLSLQDACLFAFDNVFVSVVDIGYRLRFSGGIRTADLAAISASDMNAGAGESGGGQILPVEGEDAGSGQTCPWAQVSAALEEQFAGQVTSSRFTLIRDAGGTNITAYLQVAQSPDDAALARLVESLYAGAGCLQSSLNGLSLTLTLPDSRLLLTGYQPLNPEGGYDPAVFSVTRFDAQ